MKTFKPSTLKKNEKTVDIGDFLSYKMKNINLGKKKTSSVYKSKDLEKILDKAWKVQDLKVKEASKEKKNIEFLIKKLEKL